MIAGLIALYLSRIDRQLVLDALMFVAIVIFVLFCGTVWAVPE